MPINPIFWIDQKLNKIILGAVVSQHKYIKVLSKVKKNYGKINLYKTLFKLYKSKI